MFSTLANNMNVDDVYDAIRKNDTARGLVAARNILIRNRCMEPLIKNTKNETTSNSYRNEGNAAYARSEYQMALILYNKALLYAPKYSHAMKLAYSNRSALFFKTRYYSACLQDIDTCISMGCPAELVDKLGKRKQEALMNSYTEQFASKTRESSLAEQFMKPKTSNPDLPCASLDIKVIVESDGPKIVAARDIDVGTILALETSFVSSTHPDNNYFSCFYCHKMTLNLIPCDGCCHALFCNMSCQEKCMQENHNFICPIIDIFNTKEPDCVLATKAVVKLRQASKSWKEFIAMSCRFDGSGSRNGDSDIANLIIKENKHFVVGSFFDYSFSNAVILHYIDTETDFFPSSPDAREKAILAVSLIMMNLSIYASSIMLHVAVTENTVNTGKTRAGNCMITNYGLFSFIGTLKRSCLANVNTVSIHRDLALVSLMSIKKGSEITMTHMSAHWLEEDLRGHTRPIKMLFTEKTICTCVICSGVPIKQTLNKIQARKFQEIDVTAFQPIWNPEDFFYVYKKICGTMKELSDVPYSKEYATVYFIFKKCILYFQSVIARNFMIINN